MRPTDLQFRSPKEATPGPYTPRVTACGKRLVYEERQKKCTFGGSKRFRQYDIDSKRVGAFVGPGTYDINKQAIGRARTRGVTPYRVSHQQRDPGDNGYFYVGNQLVYDPNFSRSMSRQRVAVNESQYSSSRIMRPHSATYRTPTPEGRNRSKGNPPEMGHFEDDHKYII